MFAAGRIIQKGARSERSALLHSRVDVGAFHHEHLIRDGMRMYGIALAGRDAQQHPAFALLGPQHDLFYPFANGFPVLFRTIGIFLRVTSS